MHESFGARLRRHREEQQIALSTIVEQTRIKLTLLEDLERDDVSHWPAGIFRRAFIRSYAKAVGLDPDTTVREFAEAHPTPADVASAAAIAAAIEREGANGKASSPFRNFIASLGFARTPAPEQPAPVPQPVSTTSSRRPAPVPVAPSFEMRQPEAPVDLEVPANSAAEELQEAALDPIVERIAERVNELPLQMAAEPVEDDAKDIVEVVAARELDFMAFA
ncbi:MAG: helix-turn-helix domain-containing protein, partial [Acidobacteria bacterium]|nr:helix-turn-helix domain-containing protein [Acidobacteriota bacterium]